MSQTPPEAVPTKRSPLARAWRRVVKIVWRPWLFQFGLAGVLLGVMIWQVDFSDVVDTFRNANYAWVALAFVVYAVSRVVHTWEWQITLTKLGRPPFRGLFGAILIGSLVNNVVPAAAGDVARMQIVANRYNISRTGLVTGRGAEAVINGVFLVVFLLISLALPATGFGNDRLLWLLAAGTLVLFIAGAIGSYTLPEEIPAWRIIRALPDRIERALHHAWPRVHAGLEVMRQPKLLAIALLINLFGWVVDIFIFWCYGEAFGLDLPISAYVAIAVGGAVITIFPITFGNIGTWEFVLVRVMKLYGVPGDTALAYALGTHILGTVFVVVLGIAAMGLMRVRPAEIFSFRNKKREEVFPEMATPAGAAAPNTPAT